MSVLRGDCVEVMAGMDADSVDAIVTDPPYGLEFMGKEWDRLGPRGRHTGTEHRSVMGEMEFKGFGKMPNFGAQARNPKCRTCGRFQWDHAHRKCVCESPQFEHRHMGAEQEAFHAAWATAALRVAKPGAYLLAFGGTRTVHRMTCALEDAGWIVRDMLVWAYAQGFPKSRASLKPAWEPIVLCRKPGRSVDLNIDAARIGTEGGAPAPREGGASTGVLGDGLNGGWGTPVPGLGRWPANVILTDPIFDGGWDGVVGGGEIAPKKPERVGKRGGRPLFDQPGIGSPDKEGRWPADPGGTPSRFFLIPDTRSTVLSGTIDTCPTCSASTAESPSGTRDDATSSARSPVPPTTEGPSDHGASDAASRSLWAATSTAPSPAPTPLDGIPASTASAVRSELSSSDTRTTDRSSSLAPLPGITSPSDPSVSRAAGPTTSTGTTTTTPSRWTCGHSAEPATTESTRPQPRPSSGALPLDEADFPRFYLQPKAPTRERVLSDGRRSPHPTQKPEALIRHLVTLVTPPGGLVLDPFLGSGTLGVVCDGLGVRWLGIEREAEYADWAEDRIADGRPLWEVPA